MNLLFFEDPQYGNFEPLSLSHPVYMLLCGTSRIYQKWLSALKCDDYGFYCRPYLADILAHETGKNVNKFPTSDFILINGRVIPSASLIAEIEDLAPGEALVSRDFLVAYRGNSISGKKTGEAITQLFTSAGYESMKTNARAVKKRFDKLDYLWNFIEYNSQLITGEFSKFQQSSGKAYTQLSNCSLINPDMIYIHKSVIIGPSVVIDALEGPVIIEEKTEIEPFSYIQGPCYIGPDCRIVGGRIRSGCSFGPVCRVGGEVEESIMLGYCNKYHEGFLGHAYLGEWVNLGALTTNSDLKNNYKEISVEIGGKSINTGSIKVGCSIGDHTKTGIGTMLNTGLNIGFSCNLYGAALFTDKSIPSFSWGTPGELTKYKTDKAAETAAISMNRRGIEFTKYHMTLFREIDNLA